MSLSQCTGPAAPFFGFAGATFALVLSSVGAAYGTARSGVGAASVGVMHPDKVMKSLLPVVMAGVLGIYGLVVAVIIAGGIRASNYPYYSGFAHLAAGLSVGIGNVASGLCIGIVGDAGVRAFGMQPKVFAPMVLILIFVEALALYGLIIALVLNGLATSASC